MKVDKNAISKSAEPILKVKSKKDKSRDSEQRKARKEERALKFLQNSNPDIKPSYKKGFNNCCGVSESRKHTISIAVPGSILDGVQSFEYKCIMIAQIARAAATFSVDEIIVYDEDGGLPEKMNDDGQPEIDQGQCIETLLNSDEDYNSCVLMAFLLKYLDTPEYLRKTLFPQCSCLSSVNVLPPLTIPSHLRSNDHFPFREGVVLEDPDNSSQTSTLVEIGLLEPVTIDIPAPVDSRVTVKYGTPKCTLVNRDTPRIDIGAYWGYRVRMANRLSGLYKRTCNFNDQCEGGCRYDITVGTSERGTNVDKYQMPRFRHLLLVFGGKQGLEYAVSADPGSAEDATPQSVFQAYLNTCPTQTSRTIRTEEAVAITLGALRTQIIQKGRR